MTPFLDSWSELAAPILSQALEAKVVLAPQAAVPPGATFVVFGAAVSGAMEGRFLVKLEKQALESLPRLGADAVLTLWPELFERIATAVADQYSSRLGRELMARATEEPDTGSAEGVPFLLTVGEQPVPLLLVDATRLLPLEAAPSQPPSRSREKQASAAGDGAPRPSQRSGGERAAGGRMDLLLDVELEASLRFGSREMPLSAVMELGPGDVVQLDRHVADPVDLIVGDKIVARGEVVLVNGNFGLRITEVSEPQKRLESIRCLF
ncbi:MAG TPA: FliM/FliN family flagellar motor switch protein [Acidisarcina sp.]|nr:FliM/FliN family flagellar motor switch protein [Acidisarcina sp.]